MSEPDRYTYVILGLGVAIVMGALGFARFSYTRCKVGGCGEIPVCVAPVGYLLLIWFLLHNLCDIFCPGSDFRRRIY